ncbi:MAG: hypothetical protein GY757_58110 [bacterium]|nr:hypothetical protein [bacterium]
MNHIEKENLRECHEVLADFINAFSGDKIMAFLKSDEATKLGIADKKLDYEEIKREAETSLEQLKKLFNKTVGLFDEIRTLGCGTGRQDMNKTN